MQDQKIYRHWFPALVIGLKGLLVIVIASAVGIMSIDNKIMSGLCLLAIVVAGLWTAVSLYVYDLSYLEMDSEGLTFHNQHTLFSSDAAACDWNSVQSVNPQIGGIFSSTLGYGTLVVQTADARPDTSMKYLPDVEALAKYVDDHATLGTTT